MEYFISALWALLDIVFFYFFWHAFLRTKRTKLHRISIMALVWFVVIIYTSLGFDEFPKQIVSLLILIIASMYLFQGPWYQHTIFVALGYIISGVIDTLMVYGVSAFLGISYSAFIWLKLFYVVTVSISKLVSILLAWALQRIRKSKGAHPIHHRWLLLTLLFPVVSIVMLMVVFDGFRGNHDLSVGALIFSIFLAIANIAILYLIGAMEKSTRQAQENALLHQQMEIQTDSILSLERSYRKQRQATHEHKSQLQTIQGLLANGDVDSAEEYIRQLQAIQTERVFTINSNHSIVDAVLNQKYQTASELNIDFEIQVNDLSKISIGTNSLVVLLSNLVDNAIEACCRISDNRTIQCRILAGDTMFISIRNTSLPVTIVNNVIPTSKAPADEHGFGLSQIKTVLEQLDSEYAFSYESGWFEFVAEIPPVTSK